MNSKKFTLTISTLFLILFNHYQIQAQVTWDGSSSTDWNTPANWDGNAVPTTTDDVVIANVANQPIISNSQNAVAKSVTVNSSATLTVNSGGSLTIDGSANRGINLNSGGTVTNEGTISINNVSGEGIRCTGTFNNQNSGVLNVGTTGGATNIGEDGIQNEGVFMNDATSTITIKDVTLRGVLVGGGSTSFSNTGTITVSNTGNDGVLIDNPSTIAGLFDINSSIGGDGFRLLDGITINIAGTTAGSSTGYGQADVEGTVVLNSQTLTLSGSYTPTSGNTFTIINNDAADAVSGTFNGLPEGHILTFNGEPLQISYIGGDGNDVVLSHIDCSGVLWTGNTSTDWATTGNWFGAALPTSTDDVCIFGGTPNQPTVANGTAGVAKSVSIESSATLTVNSGGSLTVSGSTGTGITVNASGNLGNSGTINIDNTGARGIYSFGSLTNNSGGNINIGQSTAITNVGLWVLSGGSFSNSGTITIDNTGGSGMVNNSSSWTNNSGGIINVGTNSGVDGIGANGFFSNNNFTNYGTFNIENSNAVGFAPFGGTSITGVNEGTINVNNITSSGFRNQANFSNQNGGAINIGTTGGATNIHGDGIWNEAIFTNGNASAITIKDLTGRGVANVTGSTDFTNSGTVTISNVNSQGIYTNTSLTNNGLIDINASVGTDGFVLDGGITVNIAGTTAGSSTGYGQADVEGTVVLNSQTLTLSGSYTPVSGNTFTIINNDAADAVSGTFNGLPEGHIITFNGEPLQISYIGGDGNDVVLSHIDCSGVLWTGNTSTDWATTANWFGAALPTSTNDVCIFGGTPNQPTIANGTAGVAKSVSIESSATLTVNSGGSLTVSGSTGTGITVNASGNLGNSGTINIDNTGARGIYSFGSLTNNSGGNINIGQSTAITNVGLWVLSGGSFSNSGTITIDNTGGSGMTNNSSSWTNNSGGIINVGTNSGVDGIGANGFFSSNNFTNNGTFNIENSNAVGLAAFGGTSVSANNGGTINVNNITHSGLRNQANFTNQNGGTINIGTTGGASNIAGDGVWNEGIFTNANGAAVSIKDVTARGVNNSSSSSGFTNTGTITISNTGTDGVYADNPLTNNAMIDINATITGDGFELNDGLTVNISGTTAGSSTGYGQADVEGTVVLNSQTLTLTGSYTPASGNTFTIINNDAADAVSGTFNGLPEGATITFNSVTLYISYVGGTGNDVVLTLTNPLPIELVTFIAKAKSDVVVLDWITASETDNKGFEIQRSHNSRNWEVLGFINGQGTTFETTQYAFEDRSPKDGLNYYRLRQINTDGGFEYSNIESVEFQTNTNRKIQLFPNPASSLFHIQMPLDIENVETEIFDMHGKLVWYNELLEPSALFKINVWNWTKGMYFVHIKSDSFIQTEKILIR